MAQAIQNKIHERDILQQVRQALQLSGWYTMRNQQGLGSLKGRDDLTIIREGRVIFCEFKIGSGKLSDYQENFKRQIEEHGHEYRIVRRLEDVQDLLDGYIKF